MGHGITVECKSCDYENTFHLGVGMMYFSLENVLQLVSPYRREKVKGLLQRQDIHNVNYEHRMFVCTTCNNLVERFDFSIEYNDGQIYRPVFRCPKCRKKLMPLAGPVSNFLCPKCGEKSLIEYKSRLWD